MSSSEGRDRAIAGAFLAGATMPDVARERHMSVKEVEWAIRRQLHKARSLRVDDGDRASWIAVANDPAPEGKR